MNLHSSPPWIGLRSLAALLSAVAFLVAACGGESGTGSEEASPAAFCDAVTDVELSSEGYEGLAEVTPEPLRADVERFAGFLADLEASEDPEGEAATTADPEYQETLQRIGNFVTDECGIGGDATPTSQPEADSPAPEGTTPTTEAPTPDPEAPDADEPDGADDTDGTGSRREEPAVPPDEVKAEMRAIFGDRLWGTTHGYFAPDGSEYEGNVRDLTEDEALAACEDLSAFIAEHPDMEGQGVLRLTDITVNDDNEVVTNPIALNETIGDGDPGTCTTP